MTSRDVVDDRLLGALHLRLLNRAGFDHDPRAEHTAFQAGTLDALMAGGFDGDVTLGEVLEHGDLGLGTVEHLGGELVVIDGAAFVVDDRGRVSEVAATTRTPFAVVSPFAPQRVLGVAELAGLSDLREVIDHLVAAADEVVAIRLDGEFSHLHLRSVTAQRPPYVSLAEVTRHQSEWTLAAVSGSVVGFRFPDQVAGIEVPGYHLHFLSHDRATGGHVLELSVLHGTLRLDQGAELHAEVPAGVALGRPGAADRAAIRAVEGG